MLRLIDGNNVFKRYFHTMGTNALSTLYLDSIAQHPSLITIVWCWDGYDSNARRKEFYPEYKGKRPVSSDEFKETRNFFKELLTHSSCAQLEVPYYEADDVINYMATGTEAEVEIVSSDQDFACLASDRIMLVTDYPSKIPQDQMKLYKVLVGDSSDNIPGLKGFGQKSWDTLGPDAQDLLQRFIESTDVLWAEEVAIALETAGWKPAMVRNFREQADMLRVYFRVISFFELKQEDVAPHIKFGTLDKDTAFNKMAELFL